MTKFNSFQMPSGAEIPGTNYENGDFTLLLPNPIQGGNYSCHLAAESRAAALEVALCASSQQPIVGKKEKMLSHQIYRIG